MALTDIGIRTAKAPDKPKKLSDSGGLFVLLTPAGGRLWRFKYRFQGKEKLLAIGAYPTVGLKTAREARDDAKRLLASGIDPSFAKRHAREAARDNFESIANEFVEKLEREGRAEATLAKTRWLLSFTTPLIGAKSVRHITASDVLQVLRRVEANGRHESARRLRSTISSVFRFAVATTRAEVDPTFALQGALTRPTVTPRPAIIDPVKFGGLLRSVWGYSGTPEVLAALKLAAMLYPRPGELRQAEWAEFDLEKALWIVPAPRAKMRRVHQVPLSTQAVDVLRDLARHTGGERLVFPSVRSKDRCISENALNAALRRMGYASDEVTAHGFRASFSTLANESNLWSADAIERALAHVESNDVRRAYARGEYWDERVRLNQWWANQCDSLRAAG
jgi:integrase